jgi:hypothetical protein
VPAGLVVADENASLRADILVAYENVSLCADNFEWLYGSVAATFLIRLCSTNITNIPR